MFRKKVVEEVEVEAVISETEEAPKKRRVKVIFTPLSLAFYAGIGFLVYRRVRRRRHQEPQSVIATA